MAKCWGEEPFYNLINKSYSFIEPVFLVYNFYKYFFFDTVFFFPARLKGKNRKTRGCLNVKNALLLDGIRL